MKTENLRATVEFLQSLGTRATWEKQWEGARWVEAEFKSLGLETTISPYEFEHRTWPNVVSRIMGVNRPEEIIMILAHVDSTSDDPERRAPGADDNGTGVAVLLETARILRDVRPDRTVMFCVFTNEERGAAGSTVYAREAREGGMNIVEVINLDMLGYDRPTVPFSWSAVMTRRGLKHKFRAATLMARNFAAGFDVGAHAVKVAGRVANRGLVSRASRILREKSGLRVIEMVGDDCG